MTMKHLDEVFLDLDIQRCANILGNTCRFNGRYEYSSVATHSVYVSEVLRSNKESHEVQLAGLLHDINEIVIGDVVSPIKPSLLVLHDKRYMSLNKFEDIILDRAFELLGHDDLVDVLHKNYRTIKEADIYALEEEKKRFQKKNTNYFLEGPRESAESFVRRYKHLIGNIQYV